jgi:hypothetical protein
MTDTINYKNIDFSSSVILHNAECFRLHALRLHHWSDSDYIDREWFSVT